MLTLLNIEQSNGRAIPFKIDRYDINITVNNNQQVKTKITQTFTNPNDFEVEGAYIFPVPDETVYSNFTLSIDGKPVEGKLYSHEESHEIYRSSARLGNNTAILEHIRTRAFVAEVSGIPANGEYYIQFEYSQIVPVESDLAKYTYPLSLAKSAAGRIADLTFEMEIESESELRAIYSPSHEVVINRKDDHHARILYKGKDIDPDDNFECYYSVSNDNFGITLFTHRADEDEDGYFMLFVSPKYEVEKADVIEKDFIFVLDHSGSMARRKIEQAKAALRYCVQNLNDGDQFNLIFFNTNITSFADRLNRGDGELLHRSAALSHKLIDVEDGREEALAFIDGIEARGGTNINDALLTALAEKPDPNRPRIIVFLTDGCPTAGVRNEARILENVAQANANQARIFVFGVGYDVNRRLLNKMAVDNGGSYDYVKPEEDIEIAVSSLFRKMNEPVLVNVELDFGQIITKELSPQKLPDMFREEQFILFGRYENHGDTVLKLRGNVDSELQEFSKQVHFSKLEIDHDFLPHLWAQRRVAELVDEATLNGRSSELYAEIERLCTKYGVETPYTSFVAAEDGSLRSHYQSRISTAYSPDKPTDEAVMQSKEMKKIKEVRFKQQYNDRKTIGRKTFRRIGEIWVDIKYDRQSELKTIEFGSKEYFDLVDLSYDLAKCLKLHPPMIICHDGVNYKITPRRSYKQA
ncbi:MAG: VIT and VWA domain-containing protein [Candidatus Poribacteria bacterium]|nr:VIT and VWA domain-containing protein [Candidatus Poribacteria bacterium]